MNQSLSLAAYFAKRMPSETLYIFNKERRNLNGYGEYFAATLDLARKFPQRF
jgi:hypothetical protein